MCQILSHLPKISPVNWEWLVPDAEYDAKMCVCCSGTLKDDIIFGHPDIETYLDCKYKFVIIHVDEQLFMVMNFADQLSIRILSVMAEDPEREFYQREIAKIAGISIGATSQRLWQLSKDGMVVLRKSGKMLFYRYNLQNPVAKQFKILLNINALCEMVEQLRGYAKRVILFGSCAEGMNVKGSDIDLLILSEENKKVREITSAYSDKLNKKVSPVVMTANEFRQLRSKDRPLYERTIKGIVLWESQ